MYVVGVVGRRCPELIQPMARNAARPGRRRCAGQVGYLATSNTVRPLVVRIARRAYGVTLAAYECGDLEPAGRCAEPALPAEAEDMTTTQSLPAQRRAKNSAQYSLPKILGIWASVTVPMAVLAFVVAPAIMPHTSLHPGIVHWIAIVVG